MKINNSLFLETTIQIGRHLGALKDKNKIAICLSQFDRIVTSTYVKMEFKRRAIRDLAYLYNIISSADSFPDIFFRMNKLPPEQKRKINGFIASFGNFFSHLLSEDMGKTKVDELLEVAQYYFKHQCDILWKKFDENINTILNETDCSNAKYGPKFEDGKIHCHLSCKQINEKCKIIKFFEDNRLDIEKIFNKFLQIEKLDDDQDKMKKVIEKALKYPQNMASYKNCASCGDLIIALECPEDSILFTTNDKHYIPLCKEIGKKIATY